MLRRYSVSNFHSFREAAEVSFLLNRHSRVDNTVAESALGERLSKILMVIGPNASGKTNLIKALAFLHWFVTASFKEDPKAPLPFEANFTGQKKPTKFEVELDYDSHIWKYELQITTERVLKETLYKKTSRLFSYVFTREWDKEKKIYLIKQNDFGFAAGEAQKVRENASLISTATQYQVPLAVIFSEAILSTNVRQTGRHHMGFDRLSEAALFFSQKPNLAEKAWNILRDWDLGLKKIRLVKQKYKNKDGSVNEVTEAFGIHEAKGKDFELPLLLESSGTQSAFVLLGHLLYVLEAGGVAVIDELESDLHPQMLPAILHLFMSTFHNPHNAQLLFTSHSVEILNLLQKSQVILVEKDDENCSTAWRLDEVKGVRADDNIYAKYMAGAYGAVPRL